jgi:NTE family protein
MRKDVRTGVVFSSGFFGFFAHAGFLSALRQANITPAGYGGTSSGAIVAAMAAAGMSDDAVRRLLFNVKKADFWDPDPPATILKAALRLFKGYCGYLKGERFLRLLTKIPVRRIEDCPIPLLICATDLARQREALFREGDLAKSLHASSAVPVLFKPVRMNGCLYVDGGVVNKAPALALADHIAAERIIVHFIGSDNLSRPARRVTSRKMAPWHIHHLSVNIARYEAYRRQLDTLERQGIEVVEVRTQAPALGPNHLERGPMAYRHAREAGLKFFSDRLP